MLWYARGRCRCQVVVAGADHRWPRCPSWLRRRGCLREEVLEIVALRAAIVAEVEAHHAHDRRADQPIPGPLHCVLLGLLLPLAPADRGPGSPAGRRTVSVHLDVAVGAFRTAAALGKEGEAFQVDKVAALERAIA